MESLCAWEPVVDSCFIPKDNAVDYDRFSMSFKDKPICYALCCTISSLGTHQDELSDSIE